MQFCSVYCKWRWEEITMGGREDSGISRRRKGPSDTESVTGHPAGNQGGTAVSITLSVEFCPMTGNTRIHPDEEHD